MELPAELYHIANLPELIENQQEKMHELRSVARGLEFVPIDPGGSYRTITFKAFDGGMFSLNFDPFEFDVVVVADSGGGRRLAFAAPSGELDDREGLERMMGSFEQHPIIRHFVRLLGGQSLLDVTEVMTRQETLMELGEFACMFDRVRAAPTDERTIIMRDGLLRTKKIKSELIGNLKRNLLENRKHVMMVGVAKTSRIVFLLQAALACEGVFPRGRIGYVKIPLEVELRAYKWGGRIGSGRRGGERPLDYSFGDLYIAKLSPHKNLLVAVEIPNMGAGAPIYTREDVMEAMSYLAKDARTSYPNIGYPQTLMKAHEYAVQQGFPTSVMRDRIIEMLRRGSDPALGEYIRDQEMLADNLDKGWLGGRA